MPFFEPILFEKYILQPQTFSPKLSETPYFLQGFAFKFYFYLFYNQSFSISKIEKHAKIEVYARFTIFKLPKLWLYCVGA